MFVIKWLLEDNLLFLVYPVLRSLCIYFKKDIPSYGLLILKEGLCGLCYLFSIKLLIF